MSLKGIAQDTLSILERGHYTSPQGHTRSIARWQDAAVEGTELLTPSVLEGWLAQRPQRPGEPARTEVWAQTTQAAARRLVLEEGVEDLVLLNFASAKNPGGGFIRGAKAQEEDVARCSGLYPCLMTKPQYYERNRAQSSMLYTDHMIYSPGVPFFREKGRDLLEHPFAASVITAPAPNAGQWRRRHRGRGLPITRALDRRAGFVLAACAEFGHRNLLLGAWGCGVFRNDPEQVAQAFGAWLGAPAFAGAFDRVVFAVYDRSKLGHNLAAFRARFGQR